MMFHVNDATPVTAPMTARTNTATVTSPENTRLHAPILPRSRSCPQVIHLDQRASSSAAASSAPASARASIGCMYSVRSSPSMRISRSTSPSA